jgi:uncharacterized membrane protein
MNTTIRNPIEYGWDQLKSAAHALASAGHGLRRAREKLHAPAPAVRRIEAAELKDVLARGLADFGAYRTDVIFICVIYPVVGLVLARLAWGRDMLPLLFPLASGFALVGPFAAVGLYEMSRQRERGVAATWVNALGVVRSPAFGSILLLGLMLVALFLLWLIAAWIIYALTLGPEAPASPAAFLDDLFATGAGWAMIGIGCGVGFLFALLAMAISVVSFPLLLDKDVGLGAAVRTSIRAVIRNPGPMALWGLIVAGGLALGSIPLFVGLVVVMPVLGHATWHLYRKVVER